MFSLRQAFNAGVAAMGGGFIVSDLQAHRPELAVADAVLLTAFVIIAGMTSGNPSPRNPSP
jgi:hypothetical protein